MSLKAFTVQAVKGLMRTMWGTKIPTQFQTDESGNVSAVEGGDMMDTGVQAFATELINRLSDDSAIPLPSPMKFVVPKNAPAFQFIIGDGNIGDGGGNTIIFQIINNDNTVTNIYNDGTVTTINNNVTNVTEQVVSGGGGGFTGTLTVLTGATLSTVGCTTTVNGTTQTVTFSNGQVTNVAS